MRGGSIGQAKVGWKMLGVLLSGYRRHRTRLLREKRVSPHPIHRRRCAVGLRRESPRRAAQQQMANGHRWQTLLPMDDGTRRWRAKTTIRHADSL